MSGVESPNTSESVRANVSSVIYTMEKHFLEYTKNLRASLNNPLAETQLTPESQADSGVIPEPLETKTQDPVSEVTVDSSKTVVLIGGMSSLPSDCMKALTECGVKVNWIEASRKNPRPVDDIVARFKTSGRSEFLGVVIIKNFVAHPIRSKVAAALNGTGIPLAYAHNQTSIQLLKAVREFQSKLPA